MKWDIYATANAHFRKEIRDSNPEYAKHLADYSRTVGLSEILWATIERRTGQTRWGAIRSAMENATRVIGGVAGSSVWGIPWAVVWTLATEGLMRWVGKLTGSSAKLALGKRLIEKSKKSANTQSTPPKKKLLEKWTTPQKSSSPNNGLAKFLRGENKVISKPKKTLLVSGGNRTPSVEWKQWLQLFEQGKLPAHNTLALYKPKGILKDLVWDGVLTISQSRLRDKLEKHGLKIADIRHLDSAIDKHIMLYQGWGKHKTIVAITPLQKWDHRIAVAINDTRGKMEIAEIKSIHAKDGERLVRELFQEKIGQVYSVNNKKISSWLGSVLPNGGQPTTKWWNLNSIISKISEKSTKKLLQSYTNRNLDAPTISQKEAKAIVRKYFSDDQVSVQLADRIITNDGIEAFGMYKDRFIAFAKNPTKYTPEHEVFHAFFDMTLSPKEKNTILKGVMKEKGFKTKLDAEEFMADTFAEFVVGRREVQGITSRLKKIFADLAHMFKKFFGKEDKVEALYRELESIGKGKKKMLLKGKSDGKGKFQVLKNKKWQTQHQTLSALRNLDKTEKEIKASMHKVIHGKLEKTNIVTIDGKVTFDGKPRNLYFSQRNVKDFETNHGKYSIDNFIITARSPKYILKNVDNNPDKINLIKPISWTNNYFVIGANRDNGYFVATYFEVVRNTDTSLKTLLWRGEIVK